MSHFLLINFVLPRQFFCDGRARLVWTLGRGSALIPATTIFLVPDEFKVALPVVELVSIDVVDTQTVVKEFSAKKAIVLVPECTYDFDVGEDIFPLTHASIGAHVASKIRDLFDFLSLLDTPPSAEVGQEIFLVNLFPRFTIEGGEGIIQIVPPRNPIMFHWNHGFA